MARVLLLLLAALGLVMAGCLQPPPDAVETASVSPAALAAPLVAHTSAGEVALPAGFESLVIGVLDTGFRSGEPSMGVTSDGTLFVTAGGAKIGRSKDHGATWEIVEDPVFSPKTSLDPWVYVDPITDRVFNAPLYVACTWMSYSDDGGDSWDANPIAGCGVPAHDHQKVTTGPPAEGVRTTGYPNVVYYQYNS